MPDIKEKLETRLHNRWNLNETENEQLINLNKKAIKSSPIRSYFVNYELDDIEKELEKIDKEANHLEITLRRAIGMLF